MIYNKKHTINLFGIDVETYTDFHIMSFLRQIRYNIQLGSPSVRYEPIVLNAETYKHFDHTHN